ncbi:hypothetical protein [Sandaracinus amylolyticus]|uniref:Uncharacterized protein n=1 Tax=Sandaracinus amylolyticus TaxID=927083 RepID=A0A0F6W605_9BACT|nr:hypothetical protein [Sandaracinus amylolyticus]AKF08381.1 hypothetical protein DB32_005530 [Sandaracinus amylolyticus]
MASKQVIDRERSSRTVVATLERYAPEAGRGAHDAIRAVLELREVMPDVELMIRVAARTLERRTAELRDADRAHEHEINGDPRVRDERDRVHRGLYQRVISVRGIVQANFGDVGLKTLGLWDPSPPDPQGTLTYARNLAAALAAPSTVMPEPLIAEVGFERDALAADLRARVDVLQAAVDHVAREESAAKGTQSRKDAAMAAYDRTFRIATSLGMALFQLGGLEQVAERIKPSPRRPGLLDQGAEEDEGEGGNGGGAEP